MEIDPATLKWRLLQWGCQWQAQCGGWSAGHRGKVIPLHMQLAKEAFEAAAKILQKRKAAGGRRKKQELASFEDAWKRSPRRSISNCPTGWRTTVTPGSLSKHVRHCWQPAGTPKSVAARSCSVCHRYTMPPDILMIPRCLQVYATPVEPVTDECCSGLCFSTDRISQRQCFYVIVTAEAHLSAIWIMAASFALHLKHKDSVSSKCQGGSGQSKALNKNAPSFWVRK